MKIIYIVKMFAFMILSSSNHLFDDIKMISRQVLMDRIAKTIYG